MGRGTGRREGGIAGGKHVLEVKSRLVIHCVRKLRDYGDREREGKGMGVYRHHWEIPPLQSDGGG